MKGGAWLFRWPRWGALVVVLAVVGGAKPARAEVERYAVLIGNNLGAADQPRLRFAEADAERVGELLGELGGVPIENQVVLRGRSAAEIRRALIATNERIRVAMVPGRSAMLTVYYSGHADEEGLHVASSRMPLRELESLVRGSAADVRLLVIDACRSGTVTRVKGGRAAPPLALPAIEEGNPGSGMIILTASSAGEDAQESDELGGSFFTHFLLSGLRGSADQDEDKEVTLSEAFSYAREQTILASSRTLGGTQHPTFHYDFRGRAEIALTRLAARRAGRLRLPADATYLVIAEGARKQVVGEVPASARIRTLTVPPGRYAIRGRGRDLLLEGVVEVQAGQETAVDSSRLTRTAYARLVRKGAYGERVSATGALVAAALQSSTIDGGAPCWGGALGLAVARSSYVISPRVAGCRGGYRNDVVTATADQLGVELRLTRAWDTRRATFELGIVAGAQVHQQRFATERSRQTPTRTSAGGSLGVASGATISLGQRHFASLEVSGQSHIFRVQEETETLEVRERLTGRFVVRGALAFGRWW